MGGVKREAGVSITFWVTPTERRLVLRALRRVGGERTGALLSLLGLGRVRRTRARAGAGVSVRD